MPKELTHIVVSELALKEIGRASPEAGALLKKEKRAYMLGTIICDSAYYHLPFGEGKRAAFLATSIHTPFGELNRGFYLNLLKMAISKKDDALFSFACGVLSHHLADRTLHPLVVYLTGNYESPDSNEKRDAQARHRFLEGLIDWHVAAPLAGKEAKSPDLDLYIAMDFNEMAPFLKLFAEAVDEGAAARDTALLRALYKTFRFESRLLRLYGSGVPRGIAISLNRILGGRIRHFAALFYPRSKKDCAGLPCLQEPVDYLDPFTGEKYSDSFEGLIKNAVENLSSTIISLHASMEDYEKAVELASSLFHEECDGDVTPDFFDVSGVDKTLEAFLGGG